MLLSIAAFGQITINTNFAVNSNQPIDTRDTLTVLSDTSNVTWTYPGLIAYAANTDQFWYYNGTKWTQIIIDAVSTAPADTIEFLVYAPAHGLTDSISTYGYVPIKRDYTKANSSALDSTHFAYAVSAPHVDTLGIKLSGVITFAHGLTQGALYYLQDDGTEDTTPGTVRAPTVIVLDASTLILSEVGADEDQVISRQAIPSPVITLLGGDPQNPSDTVVQVAVSTIFKPAGLAKPGTIFFTSYTTQSKNPTYQENSPTDKPISPAFSWLWDGNVVTRLSYLLTSVDLEATSAGLFTLDTVQLISGIPTDSTVANWLDSNYVNNNLRLPNGALLYWKGNGTYQNPDYVWTVIDDITNTTETNQYKRILKRVNTVKKVFDITAVPDTLNLLPSSGDAFINSTKDTLGLYDGAAWMLFFGGAGGGVSGSGTTNTIPLWTGSTELGDSWLSQSGDNLTLAASKALLFTGWTTAGRPTGAAAQLGYNVTNDAAEIYSSAAWRSLVTTDLSAGKFTVAKIPFANSAGGLTEGGITFNTANNRLNVPEIGGTSGNKVVTISDAGTSRFFDINNNTDGIILKTAGGSVGTNNTYFQSTSFRMLAESGSTTTLGYYMYPNATQSTLFSIGHPTSTGYSGLNQLVFSRLGGTSGYSGYLYHRHDLSTQQSNGLLIGSQLGYNLTSGTRNSIVFTETVNPSSGTMDFSNVTINPTINQTGGASGITRGLVVNPTLTAAADWRSIEIGNTSGVGLYQSSTSITNYLAGNTAFGSTTAPTNTVEITTTTPTMLIGNGKSSGTDRITVGKNTALYQVTAKNAVMGGQVYSSGGTKYQTIFAGYSANGTEASPTAVGTSNNIVQISGLAYDGTSFNDAAFLDAAAQIYMRPVQAHTVSAHGTKVSINATPRDSTANEELFSVNADGLKNVRIVNLGSTATRIVGADSDGDLGEYVSPAASMKKTSTTTLTLGVTDLRITGLATGVSQNVTLTDSTATISIDGTYELSYSGSVSLSPGGSGTYLASFSLYQNSTELVETTSDFQIVAAGVGNYYSPISGSTMMSLSASDVISLRYNGTTSTPSELRNISITIKKI